MLLNSTEYTANLQEAIMSSSQSLVCLSAFVKAAALKHNMFTKGLANKELTIIARWQKHDLLASASDLEVYELCKQNGWRFGIDLNLHGKLFLIDNKDIFLGSANLTQRGLHIGLTGNNEFGTRISANEADLDKINDFINAEVTWLNDELFAAISADIQQSKKDKTSLGNATWPSAIKQKIDKPVQYLWVQELVFCGPNELLNLDLNNDNVAHDFDLLGLNIDDFNEDALIRAFKRSRLFTWLNTLLAEQSLSFGGVTAALHSAILDDPKPYRVNIKNYNKVLFEWAEFLSDTFAVKRPRHSQVISLKSN